MFGWPHNPIRTPIGIDVGVHAFKAVQLERAERGAGNSRRSDPPPAASRLAHKPEISNTRIAASLILPRSKSTSLPSREEVRKLADVLERSGFKGRRVVLGVPSDKLLSSLMELPRQSVAPLEQMARMELARSQKCAPDAFEMGCWELPAPDRASRTTHLMAVGCRHEDANTLLDAFEEEGLDVLALDARACALARAVAPLMGDGVTALVDLGWNAAALVLMFKGAVVYERRVMDAGLDRLVAALSDRLRLERDVAEYMLMDIGLSAEEGETLPPEGRTMLTGQLEAVAAELSASFSYTAHQYADAAVSQLLLTGSGAAISGIEAHMSDLLGVRARKITPSDLAVCPAARMESCTSPSLVAAMGLALFPAETLPRVAAAS